MAHDTGEFRCGQRCFGGVGIVRSAVVEDEMDLARAGVGLVTKNFYEIEESFFLISRIFSGSSFAFSVSPAFSHASDAYSKALSPKRS